jgi:hypothetical protein
LEANLGRQGRRLRRIVLAFAATAALTLACVGDGGLRAACKVCQPRPNNAPT